MTDSLFTLRTFSFDFNSLFFIYECCKQTYRSFVM